MVYTKKYFYLLGPEDKKEDRVSWFLCCVLWIQTRKKAANSRVTNKTRLENDEVSRPPRSISRCRCIYAICPISDNSNSLVYECIGKNM